jgi:GntR family transcriptional regulator
MELFLSAGDPRPMYQQIVDQITAKVMAADWTAGQALPSIRELAAASRVSVITVRRAYEELERAGVIVTRQGKGSMVAERRDLPTALMHVELQRQVASLLAIAARQGLSRAALHRLIDDEAGAAPDHAHNAEPSPVAHRAHPKGHTP